MYDQGSAFENVTSIFGLIVAGVISVPGWLVIAGAVPDAPMLVFCGSMFTACVFIFMLVMSTMADNRSATSRIRAEMEDEVKRAYKRGVSDGRYQVYDEQRQSDNRAKEKRAIALAEQEARQQRIHEEYQLVAGVTDAVMWRLDELIEERKPRRKTVARESIREVEQTEY